MVYRLRLRGRFRVWSPGAGHKTHTRDACFVLDRDGNPDTKDDQSEIARVDQHFAQSGDVLNETVVSSGKEPDPVPNQSLWSGLLNAGVHEFTPQTAILLRGGETESAITADVLVLETVTDDTGAGVAFKPAFRDAVRTELNVDHFPPVETRFVRFTIEATNSSQPCIDELEIFSGEKNVALASLGAKATASSTLPGHEIHKLEHINDGRYGNGRSWISNEAGKGWVQIELPKAVTISRVEWARDRELKYRERLATQYRIEVATEPDQWQVVATSADRLPFGSDTLGAVTYRFDSAPPELAKQGREWLAELEAAQKEREQLAATPKVYAGTFTQPGPTHRLYRGEPAAKREEVSPDALAVLGSLELERNSPEQHRRLTFADWVASPDNPLTARVIVNRLWQFHFGTGIVATPSDFGKNGVPPTHPELLDWLASELVDSGWSLKHIHRLILLSQTWQQDSHPNEESRRVDGATLLLWRFPPRRLEAEAMRDCMLSATGQINLKMGGPGFSGFEVEMENVRHFHPKTTYTPDDFRRMIYMTKVRQERESVFGLFDCPDASQVVAARSRSTTPLQALNLLNSGFVMMQAKDFADRLQREAGKSATDQVRQAFRLAFGREPDAAELQDSVAFVEQTGLVEFCRALLNSERGSCSSSRICLILRKPQAMAFVCMKRRRLRLRVKPHDGSASNHTRRFPAGQDGSHVAADGFDDSPLSFISECPDVRSEDHVLKLLKLADYWRFGRANIERSTGDLTVAQGSQQFSFIGGLATRRIDEERAWFHLRKELSVEHSASLLGQRHVSGDEIAGSQQFRQRYQCDIQVANLWIGGIDVVIVSDQRHSKTGNALRDESADPSQADDADRLLKQLAAGKSCPVPAAVPRVLPGCRNPSDKTQHQAENQFSDGDGVLTRGVTDNDACFRSGSRINIVEPRTGSRDDLQLRRLLDQLARYLRLIANDHRLRCLQSGGQVVGTLPQLRVEQDVVCLPQFLHGNAGDVFRNDNFTHNATPAAASLMTVWGRAFSPLAADANARRRSRRDRIRRLRRPRRTTARR